MYVIIKGGCNVRINKKDEFGKVWDPIVLTLYDGKSFGELALITGGKPQTHLMASWKKLLAKQGNLKIKDVKNELEGKTEDFEDSSSDDNTIS